MIKPALFTSLLLGTALGLAGCGSDDAAPLPTGVQVAKPGDPGPRPNGMATPPIPDRK